MSTCTFSFVKYSLLLYQVKQQQSSESSSAASTEDLSEDSSSSLEDEEEAGLEYEMDSKDLCIEIKAKEQLPSAAEKGRYMEAQLLY